MKAILSIAVLMCVQSTFAMGNASGASAPKVNPEKVTVTGACPFKNNQSKAGLFAKTNPGSSSVAQATKVQAQQSVK